MPKSPAPAAADEAAATEFNPFAHVSAGPPTHPLADGRPVERMPLVCDVCLATDDHPKHGGWDPAVTANSERTYAPSDEQVAKVLADHSEHPNPEHLTRAIREFMHPALYNHHYDCGARGGCTVCVAHEAHHGGKKRGSALAAHLADPDNAREIAQSLGVNHPGIPLEPGPPPGDYARANPPADGWPGVGRPKQ